MTISIIADRQAPAPSPSRPATSGYRERNTTADRALDLLSLFTVDKPVWTGNEIAATLGVARSTGYRYLQSLVGSGFVQEADGGFRLGHKIFELTVAARATPELSQVAVPLMRALASRFDETVLLTRLSGPWAICVEAVESRRRPRLSYRSGEALPVNAGAAAQALLAWADPDEQEAILQRSALPPFTDRTITDPVDMRKRLARIRARGIAVTHGEVDEHIVGIAAPIRDRGGRIRATISLAVVARPLAPPELQRFETAVREAAALIAARLDDDSHRCQFDHPLLASTETSCRDTARDTAITAGRNAADSIRPVGATADRAATATERAPNMGAATDVIGSG